ncbi:response regulator [Flavobacterium sp. LMO8]|uniref:response regulator transcription factor n=1 Tax=Flavobacterium sp. LMO8 TaxID=2654244 RepID=UPI0012917881|nr:response regulator transcription factor [Flavobacterium sp. LMO8]MQP23522.1 response regulator [Flavobacterium sp. LMO8]
MEQKIRIILADDEELFRKGIYFLLQREPNIEIIFEASNGGELVEHLKTTTELPDIIMMDLKMPLLNGVEATKLIHKDFPAIRIIALTSYNTKSFIANMINVGAASYLVKNASPVDMIKTVNEVAQKGFYYNEIVMEVIHQNMISNATSRTVLDEDFLTEREKEVLELICKQYSSVEIGEMLSLSTRTVDGHRNNLLLKTNSKNMAGLVIFAIQNKVINLEEEDSNNDIES